MSKRENIFNLKDVAIVAGVAIVYFLGAKLGLSLAFVNVSVSPVWPPTGVAIAALLWFGYRSTPGVFLGALLANYLLTDVSLATASAISVGNTLEAITSVYLLSRFVESRNPFNRAFDVLKFVVFAAVISTGVAATIGNLSLCISGHEHWGDFGRLWLTWWSGDGVGALIVTPLILSWLEKPVEKWSAVRWIEFGMVLVLLELFSVTIYTNLLLQLGGARPWGHVTIPLLVWAAFRFGPRGVSAAMLLLSAIAIWGTTHGYGGFVNYGPNESLLFLQAYIADLAITALFLAAIVTERKHAGRHLVGSLSVTRILAEAPALDDAVPRIIQRICNTFEWEVGAMWRLDDESNVLTCFKVWPPHSGGQGSFQRTTEEITFARGAGLPGRVWANLRPFWIPDVTADSNFPRAQVASAENLHAAFAFPIMSGEKFLGVMEFFSHEIREPDGALFATFRGIGSQIGQFIERKQAEEAIEFASLLPEENPSPVIRLLEGRILSYANAAAERALTDWDLRLGDEAPAEISQIARVALSRGSSRDLEISIGEQTYLINFVPVSHANYVNLYFNNITGRKRAEEERGRLLARELAARTEAERANRLKDEFLATLSHELRTPLTAMSGWLAILRGHRLDKKTTEHAIETIERNTKIQAQLIEDLMDVSRIVGGKLNLEVRPVDLLPLIEAAVEVIRPAADAKGIQIQITPDSFASSVTGDPARLQQIIWNLLSNAVKFTSRGGTIEVILQRSESSAEIVVRDTGIGISEDFLPYVFERFRQAESTLTRSQRGLGLGLAIVRHLVELHGGTVSADSAGAGKGSTFIISLPLTATQTTKANGSLLAAHDLASLDTTAGFDALKGLRILVVEDEPDARELLTLTLRVSGAEVHAVDSAHQALLDLQSFRPDVLLSDIGLPIESGYDLIQKIRALPSDFSKIPAVALTAFASEKDRQRALAFGFQMHLAKPVEVAALIQA
ncbi:MAG: hypothetical protein DMF73_06580, partial [Acidobacteria bacterium]